MDAIFAIPAKHTFHAYLVMYVRCAIQDARIAKCVMCVIPARLRLDVLLVILVRCITHVIRVLPKNNVRFVQFVWIAKIV